jgi:peptide deformylase
MKLSLLKETDPFLKEVVPVLDIEKTKTSEADKVAIKEFSEGFHKVRVAHNALGLAANQVNVKLRMFVMGTDFAQFTCINPEIISKSEEEVISTEGCLSFPALVLKLRRAETVSVRYYDEDLQLVECEFNGSFARCFQHELDHLNGITFTDKVSKLVLNMAQKKRSKRFPK